MGGLNFFCMSKVTLFNIVNCWRYYFSKTKHKVLQNYSWIHSCSSKITIKGATQVSGYSLKQYFCMFERSQGKHNSLDCHKCFWNIFHWLQSLCAQSLTQIKNVFTCSKHSNIESGSNLIFFKHPFFLPNVHYSFWKLERILTLMIRRAKGLKLIFKKIILNTFGSKVFLTVKIMDFENVALTKVVHIMW